MGGQDQTKRRPEALVRAFQEHLRRGRGCHPATRHNHGRYVASFLSMALGGGRVDVARLTPDDVIRFMSSLVERYRPRTVRGAATALRAFFRFLRLVGIRDDRLDDVVPSVPARRLLGLPRHLEHEQFVQLLASLDRSTPRALRDRAIVLCAARLGLRSGEVLGICLKDIDWHAGVLHIRTRKTGRGALLPLPRDVGRAIAEYLRKGRPSTTSRYVFVLHHLRIGARATKSVAFAAVETALERAGIQAPMRGPYLLRHTLATHLVRRGASLKEIADLLGHSCLASTQIYAKLDLASLREVALPWPEATP